MNSQAIRNTTIEQADFDFIWFKHLGNTYELTGIEEDFLNYIDNFEEDWTRQDMLDMYMIEDLAMLYIEDNFKTMESLKHKSTKL